MRGRVCVRACVRVCARVHKVLYLCKMYDIKLVYMWL